MKIQKLNPVTYNPLSILIDNEADLNKLKALLIYVAHYSEDAPDRTTMDFAINLLEDIICLK